MLVPGHRHRRETRLFGPGLWFFATDSLEDFFEDLKPKGLRPPLLVITDGGPGLLAAIEQCFGTSLLAALFDPSACATFSQGFARARHDEVKHDYWAILQPHRAARWAEGSRRGSPGGRRHSHKSQSTYPWRWPAGRIRTSTRSSSISASPQSIGSASVTPTCSSEPSANTRRVRKVIGRLPGEQSCLTLVWAVLDRTSKGWRTRHDTEGAASASGPSARTSCTTESMPRR